MQGWTGNATATYESSTRGSFDILKGLRSKNPLVVFILDLDSLKGPDGYFMKSRSENFRRLLPELYFNTSESPGLYGILPTALKEVAKLFLTTLKTFFPVNDVHIGPKERALFFFAMSLSMACATRL